jgi:hypothetical protein
VPPGPVNAPAATEERGPEGEPSEATGFPMAHLRSSRAAVCVAATKLRAPFLRFSP